MVVSLAVSPEVPVSLSVVSCVLDEVVDEDVVPVLLPVVVPCEFSVSDVLSAEELCVVVDELLLLLLSSDDSLLLEESESFFFELSSLSFFLELVDEFDTTEEVCEVRVAPSLVLVTELVTTLVAPSAKAIETKANGVINGGVRYAMSSSSLHNYSLHLLSHVELKNLSSFS